MSPEDLEISDVTWLEIDSRAVHMLGKYSPTEL